MKKLFFTALILSVLTGCMSPPEFPVSDLRISNMPNLEGQVIDAIAVPDKPKGALESIVSDDGTQGKVLTFNSAEVKRLLAIHNAAEGNAKLVKEMNKLLSMYVQQANMIKDLAELEEARSARLESDLAYSDYKLKEQQLESKIETWSWKIVAFIALAVGL